MCVCVCVCGGKYKIYRVCGNTHTVRKQRKYKVRLMVQGKSLFAVTVKILINVPS